jgi:hypothetical protein
VGDLGNYQARYDAKPRPRAPDLTFIISGAVISIALIILSVVSGVGVDPDALLPVIFSGH